MIRDSRTQQLQALNNSRKDFLGEAFDYVRKETEKKFVKKMCQEKIILNMNIINKDGPRISSHDQFPTG